mgnify:CR=1 FL=1
MIRVEEAVQIIQSQPCKLSYEEVDLAFAVNRILAEVITADRDFPPFDRVMMDGIAVKDITVAINNAGDKGRL